MKNTDKNAVECKNDPKLSQPHEHLTELLSVCFFHKYFRLKDTGEMC